MKFSLRKVVACGLVCSLALTTLPSAKVGGLVFVGGDAHAAEVEQPAIKLPGCKKEPEKRKLKTVSQKFIKKVSEVDNLMMPPEDEKTGKAPEPDYKKAWALLEKLLDKCEDCTKNEMAQLYQRAAVAQYNFDNIPKTIEYFKKVIEQAPDIHISQEAGLTYQIASLYGMEDKVDESLRMFDKWESLCPTTVSDGYFYTRGQLLYQQGKRNEALAQVQKSLDLAAAKGEVGKEAWYRLQMAIYIDKEDYKSAEPVAETLAVNYPNDRILKQLAQIYGMNGKEAKQMALLDALNVGSVLTKESEYRNLAYLFLGAEVPYLASRVLKKGIESKVVERTAKNLEAWSMSLYQAQETDKALPLMEEAAGKSEDGKLFVRLAAVYLDAEKYDSVLEAANKALKKRGLKSEGEAHMYIGLAYMNKKEYGKSIEAFEKASKDEKYEKYVTDLLKYVKREKTRTEQLQRSQLVE